MFRGDEYVYREYRSTSWYRDYYLQVSNSPDIQQQHSAVDTVDRALAIAVESQLQQYSKIDIAVAHKHSAVDTAVAAEVDTAVAISVETKVDK